MVSQYKCGVTNGIKMINDYESLLSNLLFHLLNLLHRAAPLVFVLHSNAKDWISPSYLLLLLLLSLLQLALSTDALCVVHVVGLHHLETNNTTLESMTVFHYFSSNIPQPLKKKMFLLGQKSE